MIEILVTEDVIQTVAPSKFLPAASVGWDDGYGEGHEVDEEAGHHGGRGVDGWSGALCHSVGEEDLEDYGEPDDGIEDGGDGGEEVDVVVEPESRPDQGLHQDQGHEVNKHRVEQLVNSLECCDTLARSVILNVWFSSRGRIIYSI